MVEVVAEPRHIVALHGPVPFKDRGQRFGRRPFDAHHGVDPLSNACALFKEGGVHQIHAAGPGDLLVDRYNLAMQPQIGPAKLQFQRVNGAGFHQLHPGLAHAGRPIAFPEGGAAQFIEQDAARHAALRCAHQGIGDLVGSAARIPDVELQIATTLRLVDVLHQCL